VAAPGQRDQRSGFAGDRRRAGHLAQQQPRQDSKFFGISKDESRQNARDSTTVRSELVSDSNLKLKSAKDIEVAGSTVKAGGR
jgi:hypothetical protein